MVNYRRRVNTDHPTVSIGYTKRSARHTAGRTHRSASRPAPPYRVVQRKDQPADRVRNILYRIFPHSDDWPARPRERTPLTTDVGAHRPSALPNRLLIAALVALPVALVLGHRTYQTAEIAVAGLLLHLTTSSGVYVAASQQTVYFGLGSGPPLGPPPAPGA